jgi:hypothetical protein
VKLLSLAGTWGTVRGRRHRQRPRHPGCQRPPMRRPQQLLERHLHPMNKAHAQRPQMPGAARDQPGGMGSVSQDEEETGSEPPRRGSLALVIAAAGRATAAPSAHTPTRSPRPPAPAKPRGTERPTRHKLCAALARGPCDHIETFGDSHATSHDHLRGGGRRRPDWRRNCVGGHRQQCLDRSTADICHQHGG